MRVLIDESAVRQGVERLAREIISDYEPRPLTILGVMTGSLVLLADLIRQLDLQIRVGVIQASSYRGGTVRGELVIDDRWMPEIEGHEVLLVDDIFDTGHTLDKIVERIRVRQPKSSQNWDDPRFRSNRITACLRYPMNLLLGMVWTIRMSIVTFLISQFWKRRISLNSQVS